MGLERCLQSSLNFTDDFFEELELEGEGEEEDDDVIEEMIGGESLQMIEAIIMDGMAAKQSESERNEAVEVEL